MHKMRGVQFLCGSISMSISIFGTMISIISTSVSIIPILVGIPISSLS